MRNVPKNKTESLWKPTLRLFQITLCKGKEVPKYAFGGIIETL